MRCFYIQLAIVIIGVSFFMIIGFQLVREKGRRAPCSLPLRGELAMPLLNAGRACDGLRMGRPFPRLPHPERQARKIDLLQVTSRH